MNARELKRILRKETGCSTRHMVVLDKEYSTISRLEVRALVKDYEKAAYLPEVWDCDDIARDFVNYVKKQVGAVQGKNVAFGMPVLRDHAQEIFIAKSEHPSRRKAYTVFYMDHRDWRIYAPNKRPKWIVI